MKVLQVANFISPHSGGLRTAVDALRNGYEEMGWTVYRISPFPDTSHSWEVLGVRSIKVPTMGSYRVILERRRVQDAILRIAPDVVELSDKSTLAWISRWCKKQGIACCVISHERMDLVIQHAGIAKIPLTILANRWRKQVLLHSLRIVCASSFATEEFPRDLPSIRVIPLGVDLATFRSSRVTETKSEHVRIVMCTRLSEEKNPHVGIEAVRELSRRRNVELVVMGDGPMRHKLEEIAKGLNVVFLGHVSDRQELVKQLSIADVVLNLGPVETFGLVTLEALAAGTPVVVANSGASQELIDATCGRSVECHPIAVSKGIEEILEMTTPEMSDMCRSRASQFEWSHTVSQFASLYHELVENYSHVN